MVKKRYTIIFLVALASLVIDQITKQVVRINTISTTGNFVDITYLTNTGTLWSLFSGITNINFVFICFSFLALGLMIYLLTKEKDSRFTIPFGLLLGGILGNLSDRIFFGAVIDFINFHFWPVFNFADSSLVVGVIWIVFVNLKDEFDKHRKHIKK